MKFSVFALLVVGVVSLTTLEACRNVPPPRQMVVPTVSPAVTAPVTTYHRNAQLAIDDLAKQLADSLRKLPGTESGEVPVDEFFSAQSAEVSSSGRALQKQLADSLTQALSPLKFTALTSKSVAKAQWLVLANYRMVQSGELQTPGSWVRLQAVLAETATGQTLAKSETYLDAAQFDAAPTRFFKDAPMFMTDDRHRLKLAVMGGENRALTESIGVHALFADAVSDYDAGRLAQAAKGFAQVRAQASDHPGALAGLYQTNWQLGNRRDAEQAFSLLVAAGLDAGILSFKLLFRLGRTDFIDSDDLPSQYRMWIKSIGQGAVAKGRCVVVTGHASKSGPRELNAKLSLQRAERIVAQMNQMVSAAKGRFKTAGKGSDETVVGTGANDASDAIDRRVEFTVSPCG